jgi:hypothetical protein
VLTDAAGKTLTAACLLETLVLLRTQSLKNFKDEQMERGRERARGEGGDERGGGGGQSAANGRDGEWDGILATAHSNAATDNLMEKLISVNRLSVVRVGRAGTVSPALRSYCLEVRRGVDGVVDTCKCAGKHVCRY